MVIHEITKDIQGKYHGIVMFVDFVVLCTVQMKWMRDVYFFVTE